MTDRGSLSDSTAGSSANERYRTIVADPPWAYDEGWPAVSTSPKAAEKRFRTGDSRERTPLPYKSMTLAEIATLPVPSLAADDAHLLLWTTNRYLLNAYEIAVAWGFRPSQLLTWCKHPQGLGPGGVFASTSEFIVYARKGKPQHCERADSTWWQWPRGGARGRGAHSAKPDAFLDLVERHLPGPYAELFSRRARFGWDYPIGDQALGGIAA